MIITSMFDWYTVEYLYPKAFNQFIRAMFPNVGIISTSSLCFYDIKKLYRFFDNQGIFLNVDMYNPNQWGYSISLQNGSVFCPTQQSKPTRENIESDGFMECFKLLDKKR